MYKRQRIKNFILVFLFCIFVVTVTGCEKELTESDIKETDTYQELETAYNQLQRKYEKVIGTKADTTTEEAAVDVASYLKHLKRSNFIKVRYTYNHNSRYEISDNVSLCKWLKEQLGKAVLETNLNGEEFQTEQTALYSYTLYNEDNSICQCQVYEGDYVVFSELPDSVYYVAGACRLGDASFVREEIPKIQRSFKLQFYQSQLAYMNDKLLSIADTKKVGAAFADMDLKRVAAKPSDVEASSAREYIFKCDGITYVMEVYTAYFSVTREGNQVDWYQAKEEDIQEFLKVLN